MIKPHVGMHPGASDSRATAPVSDSHAIAQAHPCRKNIRAEFHDYSGGDYFITICTRDREHYFGHIANEKMHLTEVGRFTEHALHTLSSHYKYVDVRLFVVMPNHIHAILSIITPVDCSECIPPKRSALSVVVGGFKQAVTCFARRNRIDFGWQKRYHDHIIRGIYDGNRIADYIENNVVRWGADCYNT